LFIFKGVLSTAKRKNKPVYRAVFIGSHVKAKALTEK
jgi:hypothetical protein